VSREEQLRWEARWAVPAGVAALLSAVLTLVSVPLFLPEDRRGIEPTADFVLSIDENSGGYLASSIFSSLGALLLLVVFLYLFRAITARGAGVPRWFVYLVVLAPVLYAASRVAYALHALDAADEFASGRPIRGDAGSDRANDILNASPVLGGVQIVGTVGVAFLFVMLPLRARRVGLVTPFMGILGAIAGALVVIPLAGIAFIIQAFWLGALGLLFLGRWPGGRGPAWESGEAEPWPTAAQRRGHVPPPSKEPPQLDPSVPPPEPEEPPERPASRKRRKKRN
jgi:hypothetical protein